VNARKGFCPVGARRKLDDVYLKSCDTPNVRTVTSNLSPASGPNVRSVTGLIYLVIIALWAAVLIPMWLRRHDQVSEVRSTTRFSTAMRSLGTPRSEEYMTNQRNSHTSRQNASVARAAQRRTMVLGSLSALLAVTLLMAIGSMAPKWLPVFMAVLVTGFVVATAMTASQRTSVKATRSAYVEPVRTRRPAAMPEAPAAPVAPAVEDAWENWNAWDDEDSWEAVPSTLPTYVNSPRASVIPRPIDRNRPNEWDGMAMVDAASKMRRHTNAAHAPEPVGHHAQTEEIPIVRVANG